MNRQTIGRRIWCACAHNRENTARQIVGDGVNAHLKAPFPYFGGKSRVAAEVWARFGDVRNYVEPFCGSAAMLLGRPAGFSGPETINDANGFVSNFWRAMAYAPELVAHYADWPINEADLHARHRWLMSGQRAADFAERIKTEADFYDAQVAGWWVWGASCWIGRGWCAEKGALLLGRDGGASNKRPKVSAPSGVHAIPAGQSAPNACAVAADAPATSGEALDGVKPLVERFRALQARLRRVRVCCGDWSRVATPAVTSYLGIAGVFLDPPYADTAGRGANIYAVDDFQVAHAVRAWAVANGDNPLLRIALCGYEGEHVMPESWRVFSWKAHGGYAHMQKPGRGLANRVRERIWFSPHCLMARQCGLFDLAAEVPA